MACCWLLLRNRENLRICGAGFCGIGARSTTPPEKFGSFLSRRDSMPDHRAVTLIVCC
jgi:hypothetical protein